MRQIIDFHLHAGNYTDLRAGIQQLIKQIPLEEGVDVTEVFSNTDKMEVYLAKAGVVRSIMLAECGPGTNFSITSELIANRCKDSEILLPFGSVNPQFHTDPMTEFEHSVNMGVKGFKFYPADHDFDALSDVMMAIYRRCEALNLVIMFHTGFTAQKDTEQQFCNPADFIPLLEACPELPIIFGSDWPVCGNYHNLIQRYNDAGFTDEQLNKIMNANASALITSQEM
jgi:predicted TIM-barrel fold metal-dependent hydrolase